MKRIIYIYLLLLITGNLFAGNNSDSTVIYKTIDNLELELHFFFPPNHQMTDKKPAIVFFFGGGWKNGNPSQFYRQCSYLASRGMVAMSAQYRTENSNGTTPKECVKDGKSTMRWIRKHADQFGINPTLLAAGGGSAGGHITAATATLDGFNEEGEDTSVICVPNALVLFNPVINNSSEGYGYDRVKDYWKEFSPHYNLHKGTPPTLFMVGTEDHLVKSNHAQHYKNRMEELGIRCDLILYEGAKHGFFNKKKNEELHYQSLIDADKFLISLGYLNGKPATMNSLRESRPNVLILMSDEHSPYALGCYGDKHIKTPNLDALSKDGITFNSAYCQNPICVPSRVSLLTGRMATDAKVFGNNNKLHADTYTLGDAFSEAGYNAEWIGKEHWNTFGDELGFGTLNKKVTKAAKERCVEEKVFRKKVGRFPQNASTSEYDKKDSKDYLTAEYAVDFLKSQKSKENPFFLAVSMVRPHFPFDVHKEYYDIYKGKIKNPEVTEEMIANLCATSQRERNNYGFESLSEEQIQKAREIYYGMITYLDELYGMVLSELDKQGLRENTIILYTSDHGELMGEKGLWYKNSFYEGSVRVPFIWSYPKTLPKNKSIDAHVMNMDIFPTLCEMCDIPVPENLSGSSLLNLMQGKNDGKERIVISENYRGGAGAFMVRKGDWKYCWYENSKEQLFNLTNDPEELNNLIDHSEYVEIVKELNTIAMSHYVKKTEESNKRPDKQRAHR